MNSLSWLIYWAGVVGSMNAFLVFVAVIAAIASVITLILALVAAASEKGDSEEARSWFAALPMFKRYRNASLAVFAACSFSALAIPDKQTIVMIGASEFGQRVAQSEAVQRLADPSMAYIETWLRNEIEKMTPRPSNNR